MQYYINAIKNYAKFSDRTSRKGYWMFVLINYIIHMVIWFIQGMIMGAFGLSDAALSGLILSNVIAIIYGLFILVPSISILVRRLHDTNRSGWWFFIGFIPVIGTIWEIVLLAQKGTDGPNKFGDRQY